jgi:hypothetical protein
MQSILTKRSNEYTHRQSEVLTHSHFSAMVPLGDARTAARRAKPSHRFPVFNLAPCDSFLVSSHRRLSMVRACGPSTGVDPLADSDSESHMPR